MTPRVITMVFPIVPVASRPTNCSRCASTLGICTKVMERDQSITDVHEKSLITAGIGRLTKYLKVPKERLT